MLSNIFEKTEVIPKYYTRRTFKRRVSPVFDKSLNTAFFGELPYLRIYQNTLNTTFFRKPAIHTCIFVSTPRSFTNNL